MNKTSIEWTEKTWNPSIGCTKISKGCLNCYAESMARRLKAIGAKGYENGFELTLLPERLNQPLTENKPSMFFVNSMSDLFHEDMPFSYIDRVIDIIHKTPQHIYQVLTKRDEIMYNYFQQHVAPSNLWLGVTVESEDYISRIETLKNIDSSVRFISFEPLLSDIPKIDLSGIHWVIVGGESGVSARPMNELWALKIQRVCKESNIPFFFKQWGAWGVDNIKRSKKANGKLLSGEISQEFPDFSLKSTVLSTN